SRIVYRDAAADSLATYVARAGSIREPTEGITIMWKKFNVTVLAVFAFGFASALRSSAGTEVVEPYRAPAPAYNYAPPPPVYYPPPAFGVAVYPAFGFGFRGPRFGVFGVRRFHGRRGSDPRRVRADAAHPRTRRYNEAPFPCDRAVRYSQRIPIRFRAS